MQDFSLHFQPVARYQWSRVTRLHNRRPSTYLVDQVVYTSYKCGSRLPSGPVETRRPTFHGKYRPSQSASTRRLIVDYSDESTSQLRGDSLNRYLYVTGHGTSSLRLILFHGPRSGHALLGWWQFLVLGSYVSRNDIKRSLLEELRPIFIHYQGSYHIRSEYCARWAHR